jgi:16S rRNA (guanine(966)-N(2))-methyltransferase RsmD
VRAAIFNKLDVGGKTILDLFAGGGTLGFEALSNGASFVVFVDSAISSVRVIRQNAIKLGVEQQIEIHKSSFESFRTVGRCFEIVFMDPPYIAFNVALVKQAANLVQLGGILVVSCSNKSKFETPSEFELLNQKDYGDTKITYLRKA